MQQGTRQIDHDFLLPYLEHRSNTGARTGTENAREGELRTGKSPQRNGNSDAEAETCQRTSCREKRALSSVKTTRARLLAVFRHPQ